MYHTDCQSAWFNTIKNKDIWKEGEGGVNGVWCCGQQGGKGGINGVGRGGVFDF